MSERWVEVCGRSGLEVKREERKRDEEREREREVGQKERRGIGGEKDDGT
jgi:hypothetical protein